MKNVIQGMKITVALLGIFGTLTIAACTTDQDYHEYYDLIFSDTDIIKDEKYNMCFIVLRGDFVYVPCTPEIEKDIKYRVNRVSVLNSDIRSTP